MKFVAVIAALSLGAASAASASAAALPARHAERAALTSTTQAPAATSSAIAGNVCLGSGIASALAGAAPGDLLAPPQDVTATSKLGTGRLYRVAYATTGAADSVVASCALIAVPSASSLKNGAIKGVVAWAHGTLGVQAKCQPSNKPVNFAGPMPTGIGAVAAGGDQSDGALYNMLRSGYAVAATDYPSAGVGGPGMQRFVLGVAEGLAVLDSARTVTRNAARFGLAPVAANAQLPLVTWGHSQGGGSALWAGQLAADYLKRQGDTTLNLAGVAAEAPASQFTTSPGQPKAYLGRHLGDLDMYNFDPGLQKKFPIGVAFFSFAMASWSEVANATAGAFAFGPTAKVDYRDVLTPDGAHTAPKIAQHCLSKSGFLDLYVLAVKYLYPDKYRFFAPPFAGAKVAGTWQGGIDATCNDPSSQPQAIRDWCAWLQFNMPGPNGVNPYSKLPRDNDGRKVPIYIAQGRADTIIWCVDGNGKVQGTNCLTDQLFHSLEPAYCDGTGYLEVDYFPKVGHLDIPNAAAKNPATGAYQGSPLDTFVRGAMGRSLSPMCSADPDAS
ncbi:MAG: lipase family protein [bacterium]